MHWLSSPLDRLRDGAREYADRGWRIAPAHYLSAPGRHRRNPKQRPVEDICSCRDLRCPSPGAHPLSVDWSTNATADLDTVVYWWYGPQPWNVVLATGELFDVWRAPVDVAGRALEALRVAGTAVGPVAHTPSGEWLLFTEARLGEPPLDLPPDLALAYHGLGDYVLAPPSQIGTSAVRWWRPPAGQHPRMPRWEPIADALLSSARHRRPSPAVVPVPRTG
jgi:Bifunctional DNA primase/polymerase, N-terminal